MLLTKRYFKWVSRSTTNAKRYYSHKNISNMLDTILNSADVPFIIFSNNNNNNSKPNILCLPSKCIIYSGSFNPLHKGHVGLASVVQKYVVNKRFAGQNYSNTKDSINYCKIPIFFEISAVHPDKGLLEKRELLKRINQFISRNKNVIVSRAPLYVDKARYYPNSILAVGADTMIRILDPKYQKDLHEHDRINSMIHDLKVMSDNNVSFIVAGRKDEKTNEYVTCETIIKNITSCTNKSYNIPPILLSMFEQLPEKDFRVDISSTEVRAKLNDRSKL
jgi:nicotinic acid mononucleotide adenylyltransferase